MHDIPWILYTINEHAEWIVLDLPEVNSVLTATYKSDYTGTEVNMQMHTANGDEVSNGKDQFFALADDSRKWKIPFVRKKTGLRSICSIVREFARVNIAVIRSHPVIFTGPNKVRHNVARQSEKCERGRKCAVQLVSYLRYTRKYEMHRGTVRWQRRET